MTIWGKTHPDLDPDNNLQADVLLGSGSVQDRDRDRSLRDPTTAQHFLSQVAAQQSELPEPVQEFVGGKAYAGSPSEGYAAYLREVDWANQEYARRQGYDRFISDTDVSRMDLAEYDRHFDEKGQPRDGVLFWRTSRSHTLDDATDASSLSELRHRGGRA